MRRLRLTNAERLVLIDAAQFVLAGEWPFEDHDDGRRKTDEEIDAERAVLERASDKLSDQLS